MPGDRLTRRQVLALIPGGLGLLSGCFIEPGHGGTIDHDGNISVSNGSFVMEGHVDFIGGIPTRDEYRDIGVELYHENGTLIYRERLGTIHDKSDDLRVSIESDAIPHYVIIDSPDIWVEKTQVRYFKSTPDGYRAQVASNRGELPVTPTQ